MNTSAKAFIKNGILAVMFSIFVAAPVMTLSSPVVSPVSAACDDRLLGIPPWYRGLTDSSSGDCALKSPADFKDPNNADSTGLEVYIWKIVLNVIDMLLVAIAYIAAGFIMYGAFIWLAGGARSDLVAKGRKTILNATIGLIIAMGAIAITNLIFGVLG